MKKEFYLLFIFLILIFAVNYSTIDSYLIQTFDTSEYGIVERVVDGDTVKINGESVRLLGINSPEKGEIGYNEAKKFLEENILNETVRLEFGKSKNDMYGRKLAYIFYKGKNINLESVGEGYSNYV
jgi:micrococcal nuclease